MGFQMLANWQNISQSGHPVLMVPNLQLSFSFTYIFNFKVRLRTPLRACLTPVSTSSDNILQFFLKTQGLISLNYFGINLLTFFTAGANSRNVV